MCLNPTFLDNGSLAVPCGKCIECKLIRSKEWSYRIMHEASLHERNCFVSLTYNEDNLPERASLKRSDLQAFVKRLRERVRPVKLRLFYAGEYGDLKGRPHYHIIFFGWQPDDLYIFKKSKRGNDMYRSPLIESCWTLGFSSIELLENINQARYIALYMQKKPNDGRISPFIGMSNRPGIGYGYISEKIAIDGNVYHEGKYIRAPRYYRKKLKEEKGIDLARAPLELKNGAHARKYLSEILQRRERFLSRFPAFKSKINYLVRTVLDYISTLPKSIARFFSKKD